MSVMSAEWSQRTQPDMAGSWTFHKNKHRFDHRAWWEVPEDERAVWARIERGEQLPFPHVVDAEQIAPPRDA